MGKIAIDTDKCNKCRRCVKICPNMAIEMVGDYPVLAHQDACTECGICEEQCPSRAITLSKNRLDNKISNEAVGSEVLNRMTDELTALLGLAKMPVGVVLMKPGQMVPPGFHTPATPLRHCAALNLAGKGAALYVPGELHACVSGKAALGISNLTEKVRAGTTTFMEGLSPNEDVAARWVAGMPDLPAGTSTGTLVAPLRSYSTPPDVVIVTGRPKQAMWITIALMYREGAPRMNANFAGKQACCSEATVIPFTSGNVNFSLGCYGCRTVGRLEDENMYVGIPMAKLQQVIDGLHGLRKAMNKMEQEQSERRDAEISKAALTATN